MSETTPLFIALGIVLVYYISILTLGAQRKVVVYYNVGDFLLSFVPLLSFIVGDHLIGDTSLTDIDAVSALPDNLKTYAIGAWTLCLVSTFFVGKLAIKHNKSILWGMYIFIFKLSVSWMLFFAIGGLIDDKTTKGARNFMMWGIIFAIAGAIWRCIVNGKAVYAEKGWLTESEEAKLQAA